MKKYLFTLIAVLTTIVSTAQTEVPAFPGAEGHGRYVTGGRGGEVRHVTTLVDDGKTTTKGTLRWAVNGSAKKIVVFDVGGIIALTKELVFGDNTTIAGQTAPEPGITLRYYTVRPGANNIIRFIRFRRGEEKDVNDGADATWQRNKTGIVFDHCSFSWSIDEIASFYDNRNFTMQWCTLGEALANPGHTKGEHSYGGIWGGKGASFHHNFLCHMQNRAPRFCGARYDWGGYDKTKYGSSIQAEMVDFRNCVMYNWGNGNGCYGGTGGGNINIVNNYYKAGPATSNKTRVTQVSVATSGNADGSPFMGYCARYYINGNYVTAAGSNAAATTPADELTNRDAEWRKELRATMKPKDRTLIPRVIMPELDPVYRATTRTEEVNIGLTAICKKQPTELPPISVLPKRLVTARLLPTVPASSISSKTRANTRLKAQHALLNSMPTTTALLMPGNKPMVATSILQPTPLIRRSNGTRT